MTGEVTERIMDTSLDEWLAASAVPAELWDEVKAWVETSGIGTIYLEGKERIGAWWANREVAEMGYTLNFTKCGVLPSTWFPEGDSWEVAQAEAKLRLVECWQTFIEKEALEERDVLK